jgi:hypothetical protein
MHTLAREYMEKAVAKYGPFTGPVVEFGSRNINGGSRDLFPEAQSYLGIDIMPGNGVDIVTDASKWVSNKKYCCVVSNETFEHTPNWKDMLKVAKDVLIPRGVLLITCATSPRTPHSATIANSRPHHEEYYGNVSEAEFKKAVKNLGFKCEVSVDHVKGDLYASCTNGEDS